MQETPGTIVVLVLGAALTLACEAATAPAESVRPAESPPPVEPAVARGDTNENDLHVRAHLPGADPRWLVAHYERCARPTVLVGCVVSWPTATCGAASLQVPLDETEEALLDAWLSVPPVPDTCCAPPLSDLEYSLEGRVRGATGWLPTTPGPWREGMGSCGVPWPVSAAIAHLAGL